MQMVTLSGGRGWLDAPAAASLARVDGALGRLLDINEAGRTWMQQKRFWDLYQAGIGALALHPDAPSIHQLGRAIDTDDHVNHTAPLNEHGWKQTVYWADGSLREPWHFEYSEARDKHLHDATPAGSTNDWDDMATKREVQDALYEVLIGTKLGPGGRNHWDSLKFIADLAAAGTAEKVWGSDVIALDENGNPRKNPDGSYVKFKAWGYMSSTNAQVDGIKDVKG